LKDSRDLKLDAVELYSQSLSLYKEAQIKKDILKVQKELYEINKKLKKAGELSDVDLVDSEIRMSETNSELDEINNNLSKKLTEISYYTGKSYDLKSLELKDFPKEAKDVFVDSDGRVNLSAQVNILIPEESFEYKIYDLEILKKQKEYEIQKKYNFPKVRFDTRYNFYGSDPNSFFSGLNDISPKSASFRISTQFTVFDGMKNRANIAKAKMEVEKMKIEKEKQIAELKKNMNNRTGFKNAIVQLQNNSKTLELVNKNLSNLERLNINGISDKSLI
jgi:outer membrane protein TolC